MFVYKETLIYGRARQGQAVYRSAETTFIAKRQFVIVAMFIRILSLGSALLAPVIPVKKREVMRGTYIKD